MHGIGPRTEAQLGIVTVRSLQGNPLEEFTVDLATQWGIGPKGSARGILLFLAIQDRRSRIEVGYGLEPILPDGRVGSILRSMTQYLQTGDYDNAIALGASSIAQDAGVALTVFAQQPPAGTQPGTRPQARRTGLRNLLYLLFLFVFFPFFLFPRGRRGYRRGYSAGPWVGGFGGGGASGSWQISLAC